MMQILDLKDEPYLLHKLAQWHHREWSYLNPDKTIEHRKIKMQLHLAHGFIPSTFIAKDSIVSGSASIVACDMETEMQLTPWLSSVFVAPEYRGNGIGIGSKLVLHVMAQAKNQGIKTLYLFTTDHQRFYKKLGWETYRNTTYHEHRVTIMQARLSHI